VPRGDLNRVVVGLHVGATLGHHRGTGPVPAAVGRFRHHHFVDRGPETVGPHDVDGPVRRVNGGDALFGRVRAEDVQAVTAYRRLVARERMAVLCRGSND
jgi:hypothetical protein